MWACSSPQRGTRGDCFPPKCVDVETQEALTREGVLLAHEALAPTLAGTVQGLNGEEASEVRGQDEEGSGDPAVGEEASVPLQDSDPTNLAHLLEGFRLAEEAFVVESM